MSTELLRMPAQAPFDFRRVGLHPAMDGGVVHRDAALFQHFLEVTVADSVSAVPPDGPQNDLAPEMPPLEVLGHGRVSKSAHPRTQARDPARKSMDVPGSRTDGTGKRLGAAVGQAVD
jgi:hypothetical protein